MLLRTQKCIVKQSHVKQKQTHIKRNMKIYALPYTPNIIAEPQEHVTYTRNNMTDDEETTFDMFPAPELVGINPYRDIQRDLKYFIMQNGISLAFLGLMMYSLFSQTNMRQRIMSGGGKEKQPIDSQTVKETFADIAGLDNAKLELQEIIDFLKTPEKFSQMGAKIPKGCLLTGGPGLGKTLLARAIAGEAGVPFFACSASEFVELFVGMGAARIRDLFKSAAKAAPCIIFIDEIDAIGKSRASGNTFGTNDEREQTINQLLTEMDGFNQNTGIVLLASTNRPDILDKALVRPGRFDRQIALDPPTLKDRLAILEVHTKNKPLHEEVNLQDIAAFTPGLSGAELANIANESAILAARENAQHIRQHHLMDAIDRVILGPRRQNMLITPRKKQIVAVHEAGHAILAAHFKEDGFDQVTKISIIPRGKAGGVTLLQPSEENTDMSLYPKTYLEHQMIVALGGRVAEELCFGENNATTGASSDLEAVQSIARSMVIHYGFSEKLGPTSWTKASPEGITAHIVDKEVSAIVKKAHSKAKNILQSKMATLTLVARSLSEKEVLTKDEFEDLLKSRNIFAKLP